jgi:hypothetical protein
MPNMQVLHEMMCEVVRVPGAVDNYNGSGHFGEGSRTLGSIGSSDGRHHAWRATLSLSTLV